MEDLVLIGIGIFLVYRVLFKMGRTEKFYHNRGNGCKKCVYTTYVNGFLIDTPVNHGRNIWNSLGCPVCRPHFDRVLKSSGGKYTVELVENGEETHVRLEEKDKERET